MLDRNFARPETAQLHATFEVVETRLDLGFEIGGRNDDTIFALEARGGSFGNLH
jgi:hypothetical protein